jgi:t-SNARE complex subunit (syntaxin)
MTDTTFKVDGVTIDRFVDGEKMAEDTNLHDTDLNDAFLNQAGLAAFYNTMAARAEHQAQQMKLRRDVYIAEVSQKFRTQFEDAKPKLTEASLEEKISLEPRVRAWRKVCLECDLIVGELKAVVQAIKDRRDMVIQLGANSREEMKGTLRMTATSAASKRGQDIKDALKRKAKSAP